MLIVHVYGIYYNIYVYGRHTLYIHVHKHCYYVARGMHMYIQKHCYYVARGMHMYSRGQKKVPVPFPLYGRSTVFTVPFRFRSASVFLTVRNLHVVSTRDKTVNSDRSRC